MRRLQLRLISVPVRRWPGRSAIGIGRCLPVLCSSCAERRRLNCFDVTEPSSNVCAVVNGVQRERRRRDTYTVASGIGESKDEGYVNVGMFLTKTRKVEFV